MVSIRALGSKSGVNFTALHGDCVDVMRQMPDNSVDFSVFSPPFSGLYIYNNSVADMGNSANDDEFLAHYRFFCQELFRVMRPGRIVAVHCKDLVYYKTQRGTAGLRDLPGMLIREHTEAGFDFHSRVTIWRDPVREMTKTKAHGLLYKQLRADSSFSRQGLPEYLVVFRKWATEGDAIVAVEKCKPEDFLGALALARKMGAKTDEQLAQIAEAVQFSLPDWQQYASPVWMDTRETNVLNAKRDPLDEKHICPMPLDITERGIRLWSNPGDVVLSPFMGIGSEGYVALKQGRRFVGVELKESYWRQACRYLQEIERQPSMSFDDLVAAD